ncbi:MAG: hypothetical protein AAF629_01485 [Chloroflexota bacterium]
MTTIQESLQQLTIKSFSQRRRLIIGLVLVTFGLLVSFGVFIRLIQLRTLVSDALTQLPSTAQNAQEPSSGEVVVRLSYEGVRSVTRGPRPIVGLGFLSLLVGMIILAGYKSGQVITFDKNTRQVTLIQSDRFYRPQMAQYPFEAISAVKVERDRSFASKGENVYTVQLEIDLNDADQANQDFVYKRPIRLTRFRHDQIWAQDMVKKIEAITA